MRVVKPWTNQRVSYSLGMVGKFFIIYFLHLDLSWIGKLFSVIPDKQSLGLVTKLRRQA